MSVVFPAALLGADEDTGVDGTLDPEVDAGDCIPICFAARCCSLLSALADFCDF
jgi:hypothetical protein